MPCGPGTYGRQRGRPKKRRGKKLYEMIGESIWNTYKKMACILAEAKSPERHGDEALTQAFREKEKREATQKAEFERSGGPKAKPGAPPGDQPISDEGFEGLAQTQETAVKRRKSRLTKQFELKRKLSRRFVQGKPGALERRQRELSKHSKRAGGSWRGTDETDIAQGQGRPY